MAWTDGRRVLALLSLLWLAACASTQGVTQFEAFRSAYEQVYATGNTILDQLSVAERETFLRVHRLKPGQRLRDFDPADAAYYSDAVDPPGTAAFRRSLATVKAYNDIVYGLATGQTGKVLVAQIYELKAQALSATTAATAFVAPGTSTAGLLGLSAALDGLKPFVEIGASAVSRAAFRDYLIKNHSAIKNILLQLRGGTTVIFPLLTAKSNRQAYQSGIYSADDQSKAETYRKLLSDWVILIDASLATLEQTNAALTAPGSLSDTVAALTMTATDIQIAAKQARQHAAEAAVK